MSPLPPEPRWPAVLAILLLFAVVAFVPGHLRLLPPWVPYLALVAALAPVACAAFAPNGVRWLPVERMALLGLGAFVAIAAFGSLFMLVAHMVEEDRATGAMTLLASSVVVWVENVVGFALLYWQLDGGGPWARRGAHAGRPDWVFPRIEDAAPDHRAEPPRFVDYLFLAFSTATAFSAADTVPLSQRAKLLMMLQAMISMITLVAVAARAINVLGS